MEKAVEANWDDERRARQREGEIEKIIHTHIIYISHFYHIFRVMSSIHCFQNSIKKQLLYEATCMLLGGMLFGSRIFKLLFFSLSLFVVNYMRFHFYFISFFTLRSRKNCLFLVSIRIAYGIWYDRQLELDGLSYQSICLKNNYVC